MKRDEPGRADAAAARAAADTLVSQALGLHEACKSQEAREACVQALVLCPGHPLALRLLACFEAGAGRANSASALFRRVARDDPGNVSAWYSLGVQLHKFALLEEAVHCFDQAIALAPNLLAIQRRRAETLDALEDVDRARAAWRALLEACEAEIAADPADAESRFHRGLGLLHTGRAHAAIDVFTQIVRHEECRDGYPLLSRAACRARGLLDAARREPAGEVRKVVDLVEVVCHFRRIAASAVTPSAAYNTLGLTLGALGFPGDAIACFECITEPAVLHAQARVQVGYSLLARGDWEPGWAEHESRAVSLSVPWTNRDFGCAAWDGEEPVAGRKVLVWAEQGLGDAINFARYASCLAALGAHVVLEVHAPLVRVLRSLRGIAQVVPFQSAPRGMDYHCALMSLPYLLRRHVTGIPQPGAHLHADATDVRAWHARLPPGPNVGIAWTGNAAHANDFRRSLPLRKLLAHLPPDIRWWCVQKDVRDADVPLLASAGIERPKLDDFADTAALMQNLDAIVSIDTSVAHLAGALGRPTLLLLPFAAEWRWQHLRFDTPWYAAMRLIRQPAPGDWDSALHAMARQLPRVLETNV